MVRRSISSKDGKRHAEVDGHNGGLVVNSAAESKVHKGEQFIFTSRGNVLTAASVFMTIQTGSKTVHARFSCNPALEASCTLTEDATFPSAPAVAATNKNRLSSKVAKTLFADTIVPSPVGTAIGLDNIEASVGGGARRGQLFGVADYILKPGTKYALQVFNNNAGTNLITFSCEFSEEQP